MRGGVLAALTVFIVAFWCADIVWHGYRIAELERQVAALQAALAHQPPQQGKP